MELYAEQLKHPFWQKKRNEIIERDKCCKNCGTTASMKIRMKDTWYNISIDMYANYKELTILHQTEASVDDFRIRHKVSTINIFEFKEQGHNLFGLSDNGIIFVVDVPICKLSKKDDLSAVLVNYKGRLIPLIFCKGTEILKDKISIFNLYPHPKSLHVHHKLYYEDHYAWMYDDSELITLCEECHFRFHENNIVPVYTKNNGVCVRQKYTPCSRCNGAGRFPEFNHVEKGVCFRCNGMMYEEKIPANLQ